MSKTYWDLYSLNEPNIFDIKKDQKQFHDGCIHFAAKTWNAQEKWYAHRTNYPVNLKAKMCLHLSNLPLENWKLLITALIMPRLLVTISNAKYHETNPCSKSKQKIDYNPTFFPNTLTNPLVLSF